jgi:putative nucleotidyltransferase with HDIG domain
MADLTTAAVRAVGGDGVWAVAITVIEDEKASTLLISQCELESSEEAAVKTHQIEALLRVGGALPRSSDWRIQARRVSGGDGDRRPALVTSAVPLSAGGWSLVLSVVAAEGGGSPAPALDRLRAELGALHEMSRLRFARRSLARRLLEPGESRYPELVAHSVAVSRLCAAMAGAEGLDDRGVERAALAGLLHDVGMRELDYDRLYRLADPRPEHHRVYRKHVLVGERILRGVGLEEVADAVRHHHERWDGTGYPDRLGGDEIPWLARMVHVAEVFDVLTSPSSYRAPIPAERALATISASAGRQFDPAAVKALHKVV